MNRCLLLFVFLAAIPCRAQQPFDQQKLVGRWSWESKEERVVASYDFRADGTFVSELRQKNELVRKQEGTWRIDDEMLVYLYQKDSRAQIKPWTEERDRLVRLDESSYTIEAADKARRTYFRVKS